MDYREDLNTTGILEHSVDEPIAIDNSLPHGVVAEFGDWSMCERKARDGQRALEYSRHDSGGMCGRIQRDVRCDAVQVGERASSPNYLISHFSSRFSASACETVSPRSACSIRRRSFSAT